MYTLINMMTQQFHTLSARELYFCSIMFVSVLVQAITITTTT